MARLRTREVWGPGAETLARYAGPLLAASTLFTLSCCTIVLAGTMATGLCRVALRCARGEQVGPWDIFDGARHVGRSTGLVLFAVLLAGVLCGVFVAALALVTRTPPERLSTLVAPVALLLVWLLTWAHWFVADTRCGMGTALARAVGLCWREPFGACGLVLLKMLIPGVCALMSAGVAELLRLPHALVYLLGGVGATLGLCPAMALMAHGYLLANPVIGAETPSLAPPATP